MMKKVLVTTDLSELATSAYSVAKELAALLGAEVQVLHVLEQESITVAPPYGYIPVEIIQENETKAMKYAEEQLEKVRSEVFSGHPVECSVEKLGGESIYERILSFSKEQGVELIVMSTHGRTGLDRLVMGSVAERVARGSSCPVLLVPPPERKS